MGVIEVVFFKGCPSVQKARDVLKSLGVSEFRETDQGTLAPTDPRRNYSSPSLLLNGRLVAGVPAHEPSCSLMSWNLAALRSELLRGGR